MSMTEKLLLNTPKNNAKLFIEDRELKTMVSLITNQNQKVRKDTPLIVEVKNGKDRTDTS